MKQKHIQIRIEQCLALAKASNCPRRKFGALLLEASLNNDIFLIEACAMVAVFIAVGSQTVADIGYTYLNPRIRFS